MKVVPLIDDARMASLKVAVTWVLGHAPLPAFDGIEEITVGRALEFVPLLPEPPHPSVTSISREIAKQTARLPSFSMIITSSRDMRESTVGNRWRRFY
jgi:hypothetical protein